MRTRPRRGGAIRERPGRRARRRALPLPGEDVACSVVPGLLLAPEERLCAEGKSQCLPAKARSRLKCNLLCVGVRAKGGLLVRRSQPADGIWSMADGLRWRTPGGAVGAGGGPEQGRSVCGSRGHV